MYQSHVGMPSQAGAFRTKATPLEINTPIMPPEKNPMTAIKQPIGTTRASGAGPRVGVIAIYQATSRRTASAMSSTCGRTKSSSAGA